MLKRKTFWWLLMALILLLALWVLGNNQGYVLVVRSPYRLQFSFNFLLCLVIFSFFSLHYLLRLFHYLRRLPNHWRIKQEAKRLQISHEALVESLYALVSDDILKAEQTAKRALALNNHALLEQVIVLMHQKKSQD